MKLYEINEQIQELLNMQDDLDEDTFKDTLEGLQLELEDKADNYAKAIKMIVGENATIETEIQRLKSMQQVRKNNIDIMKQNLFDAMVLADKKKFKTDLFGFGIQKNSGKQPLEIKVDIDKVPEEYKKINYSVDNDKIREYLKENKLEWAELREKGEHLRIR